MVNYYGYAQGDYKKDGTTTLKTGFSTLLDKTMDKKLIIGRLLFENQYNNILKAEAGLKKKMLERQQLLQIQQNRRLSLH
ncbi:MAG: hypothetical protein ACLS30_01710 [Oscillospiraceae bacterium]